jgi:hypothetical protein
MRYAFRLKKSKLLSSDIEHILKKVADCIENYTVSNEKQYNQMLEALFSILKKNNASKSAGLFFGKEIGAINALKPLTEKTVWGGVALKKIDVSKDFIQKLLVIRQYGILGFEIHKHKLEKLKVLEGECLFIYSNHYQKGWRKGNVFVQYANQGDKLTLQPGDEHGMIAMSNCVIQEISTNHLDDLVYIFSSKQVI